MASKMRPSTEFQNPASRWLAFSHPEYACTMLKENNIGKGANQNKSESFVEYIQLLFGGGWIGFHGIPGFVSQSLFDYVLDFYI